MNWLRRIGLISTLSLLLTVLSGGGVFAASVSEVVDSLDEMGFYLDSGVSISESEASDVVSDARNNGSRFYLVVLDDTPLGGNAAFAESVFDDLGIDAGTILVLSADEFGSFTVGEGFTVEEIQAAEDAAVDQGGDDADFARTYVNTLLGISSAPPTTAPASSGSSDGGGSGMFIFLLFIVGGGLLLWWLARRSKQQTVNEAAARMAEARAVVQKQVDAVANDILDMEDEVRVANDDRVDEFYNAASTTYRTVSERLQKADDPDELVEISNDLDQAIWQLDSAEAILDGKSLPPQPERQRLEPELDPDGKVTIPPPRPDYQRRAGRQSSYGGTGLTEILIGVGASVLAGGGGRRTGTSRQSTTSTRSRGTTPSAGSPQPSSKQTSSKSRRSRRGGGRIRSGGKRRRRR